jgi:hypothetical protein
LAAAEKRAKDIQEKEKRAKENKRKKEQQEAKQKEEQRKLVQLGRLPEESLWGKIRASQSRLHNFFGAPQLAKAEFEATKTNLETESLDGHPRAVSVSHGKEAFSDPEWPLSSAPAVLKPQKASPLPVQNDAGGADAYDNSSPEGSTCKTVQDTVQNGCGTQAQLDGHLSFSASQLLSNFADDRDLEAELNGSKVPCEGLPNLPSSLSNNASAEQCGSSSRKRKADQLPSVTPVPAEKPRGVLKAMSPSKLNVREQKKVIAPSRHPPVKAGLNNWAAAVTVDDLPTNSQLEAIFAPEDFDTVNEQSDKENFIPGRVTLGEGCTTRLTQSPKLQAAETVLAQKSFAKSLTEDRVQKSSPGLIGRNVRLIHIGHSADDSEDDFGGDIDNDLLQLSSQVLGVAHVGSQRASGSVTCNTRVAYQSPAREQYVKQASPVRSRLRDCPRGTQESIYDLDGLDDEDLASVLDNFDRCPKGDKENSPEKSSGSSSKSRRKIPWDTSTQLLQEVAESADLDFPDDEN